MDITSLLISLVAGGAGGNVVGALLKNKSLGPMLNTILGLIGGVIGGQGLSRIPALEGLLKSIPEMGGNIGLSAIVGILLPVIASVLKKPATT